MFYYNNNSYNSNFFTAIFPSYEGFGQWVPRSVFSIFLNLAHQPYFIPHSYLSPPPDSMSS